MIKLILAELGKPDDQGNDWYGWASNQLAHAFIGVILAIHFGWIVAISTACLKEIFDIFKKPLSVIDSMTDIAFWSMGAWLVYAEDMVLVTIFIIFGLVCGVIPRLRKLKRGA
jgi:hypothetical protein